MKLCCFAQVLYFKMCSMHGWQSKALSTTRVSGKDLFQGVWSAWCGLTWAQQDNIFFEHFVFPHVWLAGEGWSTRAHQDSTLFGNIVCQPLWPAWCGTFVSSLCSVYIHSFRALIFVPLQKLSKAHVQNVGEALPVLWAWVAFAGHLQKVKHHDKAEEDEEI